MSALALDEFTLEMRLHYIETTLESLERFKNHTDFFIEVSAVIDEWISEGLSNKMNFFVNLLEGLKSEIVNGPFLKKEDGIRVAKILSEYLQVLKTEADSEIHFKKFRAVFMQDGDEAEEEKIQFYLKCVSHTHHFIVPVQNVIEIVSGKKIFPLPLTQPGIYGLISFRGQGIPVVNLEDLGFKANVDSENGKTCYVVCDYKESFFALKVHSTDDVIELAPSQFQKCSESSLSSPVVDRFVIREDKSLMLLDIEKMVRHA
ncbi:MAG TPA: chemotaxis protein CheW [Pseudobdellovibrionaceae bacterium]